LASFSNVEKTNDQSDLRGCGSGCGGRLHLCSLGRRQQRITAPPGYGVEQHRGQLRARSERWCVRLSTLFATALHAEYRQLTLRMVGLTDFRQPDRRRPAIGIDECPGILFEPADIATRAKR
jgi:hypothetical protein